MKHTYNITGMTCNGCKASVEKHLKEVDGVNSVTVDLESAEAEITMDSHITTESFQQALPEKFKISETEEKQEQNVFASTEDSTEASKLQQLQPLFIIFGYLLSASILLNYRDWDTSAFMMDFMGLFFIVFSFFKILDLKGFPSSFSMYDPLAKAIPAYGWVYPFIETALGILFLMRLHIDIALIATLVVLGITTIGVTRTLLSKTKIQCACLGTALNLPMTEATFIENTIMIVMAIAMLFMM